MWSGISSWFWFWIFLMTVEYLSLAYWPFVYFHWWNVIQILCPLKKVWLCSFKFFVVWKLNMYKRLGKLKELYFEDLKVKLVHSLRRLSVFVAQYCLTLCNLMDYNLAGSYVHGIFQARILEWVAIPFSRGSSWPRGRTQVSWIAGRFFTIWATRETLG